MVTQLEPDILECEVKWALGSITTNKASGGDGISAELFQILKDDVVTVLHSICQQIWKTQQWPRDWKRLVFIPIPKGMPKNAQTTTQLYSCHMLTRSCSKSFKLTFNSMWTENFQIYKLDLEKAEEPKINCQHLLDYRKSKGIPEKHLFCFIDYTKAFDCVDHNKLWKILRDGNIRPPYLPPEKPVCRSRINS